MLAANVRDAVALIDVAATVEEGMENGEEWDELKVWTFYCTDILICLKLLCSLCLSR